jgi:hypothetical protein
VLGLDDSGDDERVDEVQSRKQTVKQQLVEMVEQNGNEPVPRDGLVWACTSDMSKATAEQVVNKLLSHGDIEEIGGGLIPV